MEFILKNEQVVNLNRKSYTQKCNDQLIICFAKQIFPY
jgi:hypothetical protein